MRKIFGYIFCTILFTFIFNISVNADVCNADEIARLKVLAQNVQVTYEYLGNIPNLDDDNFVSEKYHVVIQGLTEELSIEIVSGLGTDSTVYFYEDTDNGSFEFDTFFNNIDFEIYTDGCFDEKIRTVHIDLPRYNFYADSAECKELEKYHLDVCDEWYQKSIDYEEFSKITNKYQSSDKNLQRQILFFLKKYYIFVGIGIVIIIGFIGLFIYRHRKRSVLK